MKYSARVFISCGQQEEEFKIAEKIKNEIKKLGFDAYLAGQQSTLEDVKRITLQRAAESEYFIFIDFKRERLYEEKKGKFEDTKEHRGSLFSHQELAVATLFDKEFLLFQEKGVKKRDGILRFIQSDPIIFSNRKKLPQKIIDEVNKKIKKGEWKTNWRNELSIEKTSTPKRALAIGIYRPQGLCKFYHILVKNLHQQKLAYECVAYLEEIKNLSGKKMGPEEMVELKWKGVTNRAVSIPPKHPRSFDAFRVYYDEPTKVYLGINPHIIDFSGYFPKFVIEGPGDFELTYVVFSQNFLPARRKFILHIGNKISDIKFWYKENHAITESKTSTSTIINNSSELQDYPVSGQTI